MYEFILNHLWEAWTVVALLFLAAEVAAGDFFMTCFAVGAGYVAIDGDMWRSVSADGSGIPEGTAVEVVSRESIILTVKPLN